MFFIILSISGVLLMHRGTFGLNDTEVSGAYLPDKYFRVEHAARTIQVVTTSGGKNPEIFVGTNHGLYRSRDGGDTWSELKEGLFSQDIRAIAVHPDTPQVVFVGTLVGIFKSEDGGDSWTEWLEAASGLSSVEVNDLAIPPNNPNTLFAASQGGLFISEDAGESWKPVFQGGEYKDDVEVQFIRFSKSDVSTLYIGTSHAMIRSNDGGHAWETVWENTISAPISFLSLKTEPEFIYVGTPNGLYKSFNEGRNWIRDPHKKFKNVTSLYGGHSNASKLYAVAEGKLYATEDGGDSWKLVDNFKSHPLASPIKSELISGLPNSSSLFAGTDAGLLVSHDDGKQWISHNLSSETQQESEVLKMDLVKLITEIHTGRFFGGYFVLLMDIATLGLVFLILTGGLITLYRNQVTKRKKRAVPGGIDTDTLIDIQETTDGLSEESLDIHDMIEHIGKHLDKCKTVYTSKEKKEIKEIGRHITTLDGKMHQLMERIKEFDRISQN
jgi:photosystem II stability/assembly factor-like uncharacterized protein